MLLKNIKTIPQQNKVQARMLVQQNKVQARMLVQQNKVQARMPTQDCYSRAFTNYAKMP